MIKAHPSMPRKKVAVAVPVCTRYSVRYTPYDILRTIYSVVEIPCPLPSPTRSLPMLRDSIAPRAPLLRPPCGYATTRQREEPDDPMAAQINPGLADKPYRHPP